MEAKRQAEEKNSKKKLLLYQLIQTTKALYPNKLVRNPYLEELKSLSRFDLEEELLLQEIISSLTLLNRKSRESEKGELTSTREDLLNGLVLVYPIEKELKIEHINNLDKLNKAYGEEVFNLYDAGIVLGKSRRTMQRLFNVYVYHRLVEKATAEEKEYPYNKRVHFKLLPKAKILQPREEEEEENPFDVAHEEYEETRDYSERRKYFDPLRR